MPERVVGGENQLSGPPKPLTVKQAAERLGTSPATVYALCAARRLRHSRVGLGRGRIIVSEDAVAEYLRANECGASVPHIAPAPGPHVRLKHLRA